MGKFADWKIHALCFVLSMIAEFIGTQKFDFGFIAFSLFPMLYVLILGMILGVAKFIPLEMQEASTKYIGICVMMLTAKVGATIGPNLGVIFTSGPALILQEFGNLATAFFALPFAIYVFKMGRACIGSAHSISRETNIAIIGAKYGLDSEEGIGVMGAYIVGTVLGTLFYGIICSILCSTGLFSPQALAMACGTGSASMMAASLGAVVQSFPELEAELQALAASSQLLSSVDGLYMGLFLALPMTEWLYKVMTKNNKNYKDGRPIKAAK